VIRRGDAKESTIAGLAGAYGNLGYMGPGLALVTLGPAAAPLALIFCFENIILFSLLLSLIALAETGHKSFSASVLDVIKKIITHPLIVATLLGVLSAALHFEPPLAIDRMMQFLQNAAAPCALFTLGVTVALRPIARMPWEIPFLAAVKLVVHPLLALYLLSLLGPFATSRVYTAVLMASLPPALNVFVFARQYDTWIEQASGAVLFGTMMSVLTVTTVMWLVKTNTLPTDLFR